MKKYKIIINIIKKLYSFRKFSNTTLAKKEELTMTKRKLMSENLKEEIAKELGVYEQVKHDGGWENIPSKTCGNMVTKAIEIANRSAQ